MEYSMPNDNIDAKSTGRQSGHIGQSSQDAVRHEKDALHHKFHKTSRSGAAARNDEQSRASTQQDSSDMQPGEGQPEIPKVGSRDAPGG
jgi:hypothetical protein